MRPNNSRTTLKRHWYCTGMNEYEYETITLPSYEKILTDYICMLCWAKFLKEIVGRYFLYEEQCSYNELHKLLSISHKSNNFHLSFTPRWNNLTFYWYLRTNPKITGRDKALFHGGNPYLKENRYVVIILFIFPYVHEIPLDRIIRQLVIVSYYRISISISRCVTAP